MAVREFYDFVDARGRNAIDLWITALGVAGPAVSAELDSLLPHLETVPTFGKRPYCAPLSGTGCRGLYEIRLNVKRVQYRLICYQGPNHGEVTLLCGAVEKGGRFTSPRDPCAVGQDRIQQIECGDASHERHL